MVTTTAREENGEFCVVVAPATRTAGILTYLVKGAGCQIEPDIRSIWVIYWLNWFNPRQLQGPERGMSSHATDLSVYAKSSSSSSSIKIEVTKLDLTICNSEFSVLFITMQLSGYGIQPH